MYGGLKFTLCNKCNKNISNNNIKKHMLSCTGIKHKKIRGIDFDPNIGFKNENRVAWNKGLTKLTDSRVAKISEINTGKMTGVCSDPNKEVQRRILLSQKAKKRKLGGYNPNSGRSKKYKTIDSIGNTVLLQSSFELKCSQILNELKIKWIRPKHLKYGNKKYFPDFYLIDYNIYLDPKNNYLAKLDVDKIKSVIDENNVMVYILLEEHINNTYILELLARSSAGEQSVDNR